MNIAIGIFAVLAVFGLFVFKDIVPGIVCAVIAIVLYYFKKDSKPGDPLGTKIFEARRKFGNDRFVGMLINSFRSNNWQDCYKSNHGVGIYNDRIVTKYKTFIFSNYGFRNLSNDDCYLLAIYIGDALPKGWRYSVHAIKDISSFSDSPYFLYQTPGGNINIGGGGDYRESVYGYSISIPNK